MKVQFWVIRETSDGHLIPGINEYNNRLRRYFNCTYIELPNAKLGKTSQAQKIQNKEAELVLSPLEKSDFLMLMDEKGRDFTSTEFANFLSNHQMIGAKRLVFLMGGAYGFFSSIFERANSKITFSQMTFMHQMVHLLFTEQLYRGFTITKWQKYHY